MLACIMDTPDSLHDSGGEKVTRRGMIGRTIGLVTGLGCGAGLVAPWAGARSPADDTVNARRVVDRKGRSGFLSDETMGYLAGLTRDVTQAARVGPGERKGDSPPNAVGFTLITPGGNYPAYWIRDFAMSLDAGFITSKEIVQHLRLTSRVQNGPTERRLERGLIVPPHSIPDHIRPDGGAVFYPGTYSSGADQGDGTFGILPPVDDHYEYIHIAYRLLRRSETGEFLGEVIGGMRLIDRLTAAFDVPRTDAATGLVSTDRARRAVGFGFCDTVVLTGAMLFPSLLRYRAAGELVELLRAAGEGGRARLYRRICRQIAENLPRVFGRMEAAKGWLIAATETGRQADVWGTLYALHLGVLRGTRARRALETVVDAVRHKTIVFEGGVRHVPLDLDAAPGSAWEETARVPLNTYQNGAYWHTPTGWLIAALHRVRPDLAAQIVDHYLRHLREGDFRRGPDHHAPWECFARGGYAQNGVYLTSVAVPYAVLTGLRGV